MIFFKIKGKDHTFIEISRVSSRVLEMSLLWSLLWEIILETYYYYEAYYEKSWYYYKLIIMTGYYEKAILWVCFRGLQLKLRFEVWFLLFQNLRQEVQPVKVRWISAFQPGISKTFLPKLRKSNSFTKCWGQGLRIGIFP